VGKTYKILNLDIYNMIDYDIFESLEKLYFNKYKKSIRNCGRWYYGARHCMVCSVWKWQCKNSLLVFFWQL